MRSSPSASLVCRLYGISSGQLYTRRQKFRTGELTGLAPVTLASLVGQLPTAATPVDPMWTLPVADQPARGTIEVAASDGRGRRGGIAPRRSAAGRHCRAQD